MVKKTSITEAYVFRRDVSLRLRENKHSLLRFSVLRKICVNLRERHTNIFLDNICFFREYERDKYMFLYRCGTVVLI